MIFRVLTITFLFPILSYGSPVFEGKQFCNSESDTGGVVLYNDGEPSAPYSQEMGDFFYQGQLHALQIKFRSGADIIKNARSFQVNDKGEFVYTFRNGSEVRYSIATNENPSYPDVPSIVLTAITDGDGRIELFEYDICPLYKKLALDQLKKSVIGQ